MTGGMLGITLAAFDFAGMAADELKGRKYVLLPLRRVAMWTSSGSTAK